jgi:hypothetical protein
MRYIVTGGAGFIGSNLADTLAQHHDVVIIDNLATERRGEDRAPPGSSPGNVYRGEHHRPRSFNVDLLGCRRVLPPGGHPLGAAGVPLHPRAGSMLTELFYERARQEFVYRGIGTGIRMGILRKSPKACQKTITGSSF